MKVSKRADRLETIPCSTVIPIQILKLNRKNACLSLLTTLFVIVFLEGVLTLGAILWPNVNQLLTSYSVGPPQTIVDDRLGLRGNPEFPGHDSKGFRNPKVPGRADIVVFGDSHTYGVWVEPEDTWPRQLESIIHSTVYNMAFSGCGPVDSLLLWDEALSLRPKTIIEAFYAGNDLFDAYSRVYRDGKFPELKSNDPIGQNSIQSRNALDAKNNIKLWLPPNLDDDVDVHLSWPHRLLSKHSKLYGLLRRVRYELVHIYDTRMTSKEKWKGERWAKAHPGCCEFFDDGHVRTISEVDYRLVALDQEDPRVLEGRRISFRVIKRLNDLALEQSIRFIVLLVPTKELVFKELWSNPTKRYLAVTQNEERLWKITKSFLKETGVEYLDALSALRKQLTSGNQPYQESTDSHPNKYGHAAIAKLVAAYLKADNN